MKRDEVFPSKYLKASDLGGKPLTVVIEKAPLEVLKSPEGKEEAKTVLYFRGLRKRCRQQSPGQPRRSLPPQQSLSRTAQPKSQRWRKKWTTRFPSIFEVERHA